MLLVWHQGSGLVFWAEKGEREALKPLPRAVCISDKSPQNPWSRETAVGGFIVVNKLLFGEPQVRVLYRKLWRCSRDTSYVDMWHFPPIPGQEQKLRLCMKCWDPTPVSRCDRIQTGVTLSVSTSSPRRAASMKISRKCGQPFASLRSSGLWCFGPWASPVPAPPTPQLLSRPEPSWA